MKFKKFISECREKGVLKNLSIYIVSSWVLLQVVALVAEPLGFSSAIVAYLLLALLVGFPLYVYWVWKFQLADSIEKLPKLDKTGEPVPGKFIRSPFQKLYFTFLTVISIVALGITFVVAKKNFIGEPPVLAIETSDKIAVLKFDNNTGDEKYDIAGKMAVDWIIHGITQNKVGQVISPEIVDDYSEILKASMFPDGEDNFVMDYLKPSKIIEGEFFLNRNRLLFQCSIRDELMDETLMSFKPVECDPSAPLECIEALTKRILGYLVTENNGLNSLQRTPPNFEAYQYLEKAKNQGNNNNYPEYLRLLDKAISADSTFFEPKLYKFMYYYNTEQYKVADSIRKRLNVKADVDARQQNILNVYRGLLEGNYKMAYEFQEKEYNITPFHLETNSSMMTFSLQLINKPQAVDSIYRVVDMKDGMLQNCAICAERYKIKALSDIELRQYEEAISLLDDFASLKGYAMLKKVLLRAYIRSAKNEVTQKLLSTVLLSNPQEWIDIYLFAAKEFLIMDNKELANQYLEKISKAITTTGTTNSSEKQIVLAEALFLSEQYVATEAILQALLKEDPSLITQTALLAIAYQKNGKSVEAEKEMQRLAGLKSEYQYGSTSYAMAQYYAAMADDKNTIAYLTKAVAEGHWYETSSFQNDPFFKAYLQTDAFKRVLTFWH
ncbi:hypothetical protein N9954_02455 [Maribacter sp.]|nr:hypothetical protein [Maribacter sp.]